MEFIGFANSYKALTISALATDEMIDFDVICQLALNFIVVNESVEVKFSEGN